MRILSQKRAITLLQAADESGLVARLSLSRLEPPSRSNLPKDPPSKTATLHKKDDTDTRIIFKSCGTACSLLRFQRLTANFLLCLPALRNTNLDNKRTQTRFGSVRTTLRNAAALRPGDAPPTRETEHLGFFLTRSFFVSQLNSTKVKKKVFRKGVTALIGKRVLTSYLSYYFSFK